MVADNQCLILLLSPSSPPAAIDLLYGGIFCFVCQDYIYDKDMEQIAKEEQRKAWKLQGKGQYISICLSVSVGVCVCVSVA